MTSRAIVVGGGVAGLTTAYRLLRGPEPVPEVTVLEAETRAGGKLRSVEVGGLRMEAGPDSIVARKPAGVELCRELGLGGELISPAAEGTFLWTEHGLERFPAGFPFGMPADYNELLRLRGISMRGKLRAVQDLWRKPRRDETDEPMGDLLRRRLGSEVAEFMVGPLLEGLFAGDLDKMSVLATFPELALWERERGGLIRGARSATRRSEKREREPMFLRPAGGTERLTQTLFEAVGAERIRTEAPVSAIERSGDGWTVQIPGGRLDADVLVLATPAFESARLLAPIAPQASTGLAAISYASTAVVFLVYEEGTQPKLPSGTGFIVPRGRAPMTACTWVSSKWPVKEFGARAIMRCYVGGAGFEDVLDSSDEEMVAALERHLTALLPLPPQAETSAVVRWERAMPQYEVGHLEKVAAIEAELPPGVFVTGQAFRGAGIADTVRQAGEAAEAVRSHMETTAERAAKR